MIEALTWPNSYAFYLAPLLLAWLCYAVTRWRAQARSRARRDAAYEAGLSEPASLHPVIDAARCFGCGACIHVCPEGQVLGLIDGKAALVEPAACIGHGACKAACPTDAISLVFGSAQRGVDIPRVSPSFETNVPGVFIAGELGGMGLIANAIEQGRQALDSISRLDGLGQPGQYDVVIVGAGPAGFAASLAAKERSLRYLTLEQDSFGGSVAHYPRNKLITTRPVRLPFHDRKGKFRKFRHVRKERLLQFWHDVARQSQLAIHYGKRVEQVLPLEQGFEVRTAERPYRTRAVLLATGRRGTPRKLGVPGENQTKVVYSLVDPAQYRGLRVLVVGGGDSALEAAVALARLGNCEVTLCHRGPAFTRALPRSRARLEEVSRGGRVAVLLDAEIRAIRPDSVDISLSGTLRRLQNDAVIICAGGLVPTTFLKRIGIEVETKYGVA